MGDRVAVSGRVLEVLACPACDGPVAPTAGGGIRCNRGHEFKCADGYLDTSATSIPDAVTTRTAESFGYEWNTFDDVRDEDARFAAAYFRDVDLTSLSGKVGLDAGCGKGRYTRFLAPHLDALVALDGSSAVEAAARNLGEFSNVLVVKADLRHAPLRAGSIDFISCLGVLHHLDDPREGFRRLRRLLAPGGTMLVYVYSKASTAGVRRVGLWLSGVLRRATVRMPHRMLRLASVPVAAALFVGVVQLGRLGERMGVAPLARLPMAAYRGKSFRSLELDTFDRLSAPVEHRYEWPELRPWFEEAGLEVLAAREEAGWFVLARDPGSTAGAGP